MRIDIKSAQELSDFEKARTDCVVTSSLYSYLFGLQWADPAWSVMVWEGDELVSNIYVFERDILVGETRLHVAGIGNIATKVEWRNRGFASAALQVAQKFLHEQLLVDFGLMTCIKDLIPRYEKSGWKWCADSLVMEQDHHKQVYPYFVMVLPVRKQEWPTGTIDLQGLPW